MHDCADCDFDWRLAADEISGELATRAPRYRALILPLEHTGPSPDELRTRPAPDVWSPLEYLGHMGDVADFYHQRLHRVLTEHRPVLAVGLRFADLAERRNYRDADPEIALRSFEGTTAAIGRLLDDVEQDQWSLVGIGSEGDERTLLLLARRYAHEVHHHLADIDRQLNRRA